MAPPRKLLPDKRTLKMITNLRGSGCTMREAAILLGVGYTTFKDNLKSEPRLREAWERGKALQSAALKRRMYEVAMDGDGVMIRALMRRMLGEKW